MPDSPPGPQAIPAAPVRRRRGRSYWSVRRELWENRSIYIAPLVVAGVVLFGFLIATVGLPHAWRRRRRRSTSAAALVVQPYALRRDR